jgi:hypothetical protein
MPLKILKMKKLFAIISGTIKRELKAILMRC